MKAKTHVFCLFRVFFSIFPAKLKSFFMPLPHVTLSHRISELVIFLFLLCSPSLSPSLFSQCVLFKSWSWESDRLSHSLCGKLLLGSCPFSWCTLLSKLNKGCETLAGKGTLYLILCPSAAQCGGKSSQGGSTHILNILQCSPGQLIKVQFEQVQLDILAVWFM